MKWTAPCATSSPSRPRPASISATTASSSASASRLMCLAACRVSPANQSAAAGRDFEEFPALVEDLMRRFPKRSRMQNAPEAQAELHYLDSSAIAREIDRFQRAAKRIRSFRRELHDGAFARHHLHHDAERVLRFAAILLDRAGARDAQRVSRHPSRRPAAADRRAGSRHGSLHVLPRSFRSRNS